MLFTNKHVYNKSNDIELDISEPANRGEIVPVIGFEGTVSRDGLCDPRDCLTPWNCRLIKSIAMDKSMLFPTQIRTFMLR